ncbi:MAG: WG repeat-containing protein [Crocinitomicaceae bacterium]|nr:WG repeat-containing protein [Flavobacteriales bacterium]NQZ36495.1 WG repeat-containing protein [Crocinitomicaceae bacterium]
MIRFATILLFLGASLSLFGQQALSDNINGQWCIYSEGERIDLEPSIHELGNFDEVGLTFFMQYEQYGIMSEKGVIVLEQEYNSIKQLGGGYYLLLDDEKKQILVDWRTDHVELREVKKVQKLQTNWYHVTLDSVQVLINLLGQKEWTLSGEDEVIESDFNYVHCEIDGNLILFDPNGGEIFSTEGYPIFGKNYLLISDIESKKVIYRTHEVDLPTDASGIRIREDEIMYSQTGKSTIISSLDGRVISELPFEDISYYNDNLLLIRNNGKVGLARKTGEMLIPTNYASISVLDGLYYVRSSKGAGVLDNNGRELIPCKYSYVVAYRDFFTVHNELDFSGLISRKTGKTILPCDYLKLTLNDSVIRGFTGDILRIIQLDSNHRVLNDIVMSNVTSLVNTEASIDVEVDERLYPLGWFTSNVPKYDSLGFLIDEVSRWGLKGANDSIIIPARYKEPIFVDQADFSLLNDGRRSFKIFGLGKVTLNQYKVMSHRTGKRLIPEMIISIDTMDLLTRSYARFVSEKGAGVLLDDNSILRVDYIDGNDSRYVRYCTSRRNRILSAKKTDFDALRFFDFDLNNDPTKWIKINLNRKKYEFIRYEKAEWNFLDTNGKNVFTDPFDFAYPYSQETSIVKMDGKWGVARADSFAIPISYASIKRSPVSDTLFVVKKNNGGTRFLDTNGRVMSNGMTRFFSSKENFSQIEINGNKKLIAPDYSIISGDTRFQKLFDNNIFFSKENKKYTIYNQYGILLGAVELRPEEVWFEEYVKTKSRGKRGVLSMDNDTLIPFKYKKITSSGSYIFAQDGNKNLLYDQNMILIDNLKSNDILVDSVSGNYAVISESKATIYSSTQRKLGRFNGMKFEHFHNGYLIEFGKTLRVLNLENEFTFDFEPRELEVMGENGYLVIDSDKMGHYFNQGWDEITFDQPLSRVKFVGEGLALSRSRKSTLLFGGDVEVKFSAGHKSIGGFRNGFLLLEYGKECKFVDVNGVNQFKRIFDDAEPFSGRYASVKEKDGWTIIDGDGYFQVLPGFDKITPLTKTIFSTPSQPVFGLFDAHGNELIPVEFQQLNFLRNGIVQGRKNGKIFYFDRNGESISLN